MSFPDRERDNAFVESAVGGERLGWLAAEKRKRGGQ